MGVEQGQIGKTEEMADLNKNQDPGADSLSVARPYRPLSLRARLILATEYINCLHWGTQEDGKGLSFLYVVETMNLL